MHGAKLEARNKGGEGGLGVVKDRGGRYEGNEGEK